MLIVVLSLIKVKDFKEKMENSEINSSPSEPTISGVKAIFKKPSNVIHAFEVSMNESTTMDISKGNMGLDVSSVSDRIEPFKKPSTLIPQTFSVNSDESMTDSEFEKSAACTKSLFRPKKKLVNNLFNVSFNESNLDGIQNKTFDKSGANLEEDSTMSVNKSNLFKRKSKTDDKPLLEKKPLMQVSSTNEDGSAGDTTVKNSEINSSPSEPTISGVKTIFKKPRNVIHAFEVSMNESTTVDITKGKIGLDVSSVSDKIEPFKKPSTLIPQTFSVNSDESQENMSVDESSLNTDIEPTNFINKSNPFKKNIEGKEQYSMNISMTENKTRNSVVNKTFETDKTKKSISSGDCINEEIDAFTNLNTTSESKKNKEITSGSKELQNTTQMPSLDDDTGEKSMESRTDALLVPEKSTDNFKFDKSLSKLTNKSNTSEMLLDQSSFNDENLNNWMSDHSDEEMPPPTIPPVTKDISVTKEKTQEKPLSPVKTNWEEKFNEIVSKTQKRNQKEDDKTDWKKRVNGIVSQSKKGIQNQSEKNTHKSVFKKIEEKPVEESKKYKPPKLAKPAFFATKRLYQYIIKKLEPKYGVDTMIEAEQLVFSICDTVKKVTRRKGHQKKLIQDLKTEMAKAGVVETTADFYEFVINFLPYTFRIKVVPCVQPVSNTVFPPKDGNPFDKILN